MVNPTPYLYHIEQKQQQPDLDNLDRPQSMYPDRLQDPKIGPTDNYDYRSSPQLIPTNQPTDPMRNGFNQIYKRPEQDSNVYDPSNNQIYPQKPTYDRASQIYDVPQQSDDDFDPLAAGPNYDIRPSKQLYGTTIVYPSSSYTYQPTMDNYARTPYIPPRQSQYGSNQYGPTSSNYMIPNRPVSSYARPSAQIGTNQIVYPSPTYTYHIEQRQQSDSYPDDRSSSSYPGSQSYGNGRTPTIPGMPQSPNYNDDRTSSINEINSGMPQSQGYSIGRTPAINQTPEMPRSHGYGNGRTSVNQISGMSPSSSLTDDRTSPIYQVQEMDPTSSRYGDARIPSERPQSMNYDRISQIQSQIYPIPNDKPRSQSVHYKQSPQDMDHYKISPTPTRPLPSSTIYQSRGTVVMPGSNQSIVMQPGSSQYPNNEFRSTIQYPGQTFNTISYSISRTPMDGGYSSMNNYSSYNNRLMPYGQIGMISQVPDPQSPFTGVHQTIRTNHGIRTFPPHSPAQIAFDRYGQLSPGANSGQNSITSTGCKYDPSMAGVSQFRKMGFNARLKSKHIYKVARVERIEECERYCLETKDFICKSFNFRPFFPDNCELSNVDTKKYKLEDLNHFEHNTQFDYYERDDSKAMMMSNSMDCFEVLQTCSPEGMEFKLITPEGFYGRIYTYGFYDSCFFDGNGGTTSILKISKSNGFPRCGTQQINPDAMTNIVVVQFNDFVQTSRDKKYNLTCIISGPGEAVVTSNYLDTKTDGRHPMQIEHLPAQNILTSNVVLRVLYRGTPTNTIVVGDLLTFRLESRNQRKISS